MAPDEKQTDKPSGDDEFERTVTLVRCEKHGIAHYITENCPECDKEQEPSNRDA